MWLGPPLMKSQNDALDLGAEMRRLRCERVERAVADRRGGKQILVAQQPRQPEHAEAHPGALEQRGGETKATGRIGGRRSS